MRRSVRLAIALTAIIAGGPLPPSTDADPTGEHHLEEAALRAIDGAIEAAIGRGEIPGAVIWIESRGEVYQRAYGQRSVIPGPEPMTTGTLFDLASLTKVLATTPAILQLIERGQLGLDDLAARWIPELAGDADREHITVRQLLTHTSGLIPVVRRRDAWWGHETGIRRAAESEMWAKPDEQWRYSDVNFILLGEIVRRVSGQRLDHYTWEQVYRPLGMDDTGFNPRFGARSLIAPTEDRGPYGLIHGQVHDPVARRMDGVAGHAGLFSTAEDIARLLRMLLNDGRFGAGDARLFTPQTIALMTSVQTPDHITATRGLGWDIGSPYSGQRGDRFPAAGYGHTGWTGTCLWVDPGSETFYILLANRNHPSEAGKIKQLRHRIGSLVAEAAGLPPRGEQQELQSMSEPPAGHADFGEMRPAAGEGEAAPEGATVLNGIDVLAADDFAALAGKRVGLITNHTGIDRQRRSTIDRLAAAEQVDLAVLFSPEHGIRGTEDTSDIADDVDAATGLKIHSLYQSDQRKPSPGQLAGLDALVFDIQDIGCRFYTYIATMGNCLEAAAENDLEFIVLDRVNPIGGLRVEGPVRDGPRKFTAWHDIPVRHGMTVGELAAMFVAENQLDVRLTVVPVRHWRRDQDFDQTGLPWVNPSPNMRSLTQALLYPGIGLLEFTDVSVGRGTDTPFEIIGAPWIDDLALAADLDAAGLEGIRFIPIRFTPEASVHAGEECGGVRFVITDRASFRPIQVGLTLAAILRERYPDAFDFEEKGNILLQHPAVQQAILDQPSDRNWTGLWTEEMEAFLARRARFLRYE